MKKELLKFARDNKLSPFNSLKTQLKNNNNFFKTRDAKNVYNRLISKLSESFVFTDTSNLFSYFDFSDKIYEIKNRQNYFKSLEKRDNSFLREITRIKNWWNPDYGIVVVTEDEKSFSELQKLGCPVKFLITENDLESLNDYDIVQVIECENFSRALEHLEQSVFLDSMDEVYLERYLNILSGWAENIKVLERSNSNDSIKEIAEKLYPLLELFESNKEKKITRGEIDVYLMEINKKISEEVKGLSVSGESLFNMMSRNVIPKEIKEIIERAIRESNVPNNVFTRTMPVEIDENEIENLIRRQDSAENTSMAKRIKKEADMLRKVPEMLDNLAFQMLIFDFESGISSYLSQANDFPEMSENVIIYESKNVFLENAQAISFNLSEQNKCSILTGANSGGKTTLIEHVIQLYCFFQLGLPTIGRINTPLFTEIYYFAKNKGSINKGAFETLLSQMSEIKAGNKTLILADEIESVTEPGVAGDIISASAEYFIRKGCFLIIATHLGKEIEKNMPIYARIDGIEAKGLDSNFDLIVDHNPVIGRLANSTPELIIEKMANTIQNDYFKHLFDSLKNK